MNHITIRKGVLSDAQLLAELNHTVQKLHADAYPQLFKQPGQDESMVVTMAQALENSLNYFFIAEVDGKPAGYIFAAILERAETAMKLPDRQMYINQMSIQPAFQRQGCGTLLLEAVRKLAQSLDIHTLGVDSWAFNQQAISFFQSHGFIPNNIRMSQQLD